MNDRSSEDKANCSTPSQAEDDQTGIDRPSRAVQARVLVVDDAPSDLKLLHHILVGRGYQVDTAPNGTVALERLRTTPFDLVLLDIKMPDLCGYEVCRQLKASKQTRDIPVIFLSALDEALDVVRAFRVGGADYVPKPLQIEEILARVKHHLALRTAKTRIKRLNAELQQAFKFESKLKQIADKIRSSLDKTQILQITVQELAIALHSNACSTSFPPNQPENTCCYSYDPSLSCPEVALSQILSHDPDLFQELINGQNVQFCPLAINHSERWAVLVCPICSNQEQLGVLYFFREPEHVWRSRETELVCQVADRSAIALSQAQLYEQSQAQVEELARLNQLKDDFLNTVSHELRTPMSSINLATQMLEIHLRQRGLLDDESDPITRYIRILQQEGQQEIQLINDLLDLTRLDADVEPLMLSTIALRGWISHLAEPFIERAMNQRQTLRIEVPEDLPPISTDFSYLGRVLSELLQNACKYTPREEQIVVMARITGEEDDDGGDGEDREASSPPSSSFSSPSSPSLQISVCNSGIEIPEPERDRIFDTFYRIPCSDPWQHSGTGLGLALVKKLVRKLGGSIELQSANNLTCFTIRLPLN